jgi:hypothetical protein
MEQAAKSGEPIKAEDVIAWAGRFRDFENKIVRLKEALWSCRKSSDIGHRIAAERFKELVEKYGYPAGYAPNAIWLAERIVRLELDLSAAGFPFRPSNLLRADEQPKPAAPAEPTP